MVRIIPKCLGGQSGRMSSTPDRQTTQSDNEQVVDAPKEIRILGKISRVHIQGNDLYQDIVFSPEKRNRKKYVIIPIKSEKSEIQFIKVPVHKLHDQPNAKRIGKVNCQKINKSGEEVYTEELDKWSSQKRDFQRCLAPLPVIPAYLASVSSISKKQDQEELKSNLKNYDGKRRHTPPKKDVVHRPHFEEEKATSETQTAESKQRKDSFKFLSYLITEKDKPKTKKGKKNCFKKAKK